MQLEKEVTEISANERRRIGADLHDGLGQQLTAIEILCAGLKADVAANGPAEKQVARIGQLLRESIGQVRALAHGLVPVKEAPDSLWAGLMELAERTNSLGRAECRLDSRAVVLVDDPGSADQLYRIAQEAVNNAVKHSQATRIQLGLARHNGVLELKVTDNGRGFAVSQSRGIGLQVMHHRASVIGAGLFVESKPGHGTSIICRWQHGP
jgi:signal transduction histidine kinase